MSAEPGAQTLTIARVDPRQAPGPTLVAELDRHLLNLYPAESQHLLGLEPLAAGNARFLVASVGAEPQGCGAVKLLEPGVAELKRLYVRAGSRGRGVGGELLAALEVEARALGAQLLRLETGVHQPEALRLYEAHGYRRRGPFGDYTADPLCRYYEKTLS